jgi:hypothetical protein
MAVGVLIEVLLGPMVVCETIVSISLGLWARLLFVFCVFRLWFGSMMLWLSLLV